MWPTLHSAASTGGLSALLFLGTMWHRIAQVQVDAFQFQVGNVSSRHSSRISFVVSSDCHRNVPSSVRLAASNFANDDDDDDDDLSIDPNSLGDWRAFRSNLANSGISTPADVPKKKEQAQKRKSVSKENEKLLKRQNTKLAEEYMTGVWAHTTAEPEAGGLVCRLPLEIEIMRNYKHSAIGKKLRTKVDWNDEKDYDSSIQIIKQKQKEQQSSSVFYEEEDESSDSSNNNNNNQELSSAKTVLWYRAAKRLIEEEMMNIATLATEDGQLDAASLGPEAAEMLGAYLDNQETWQEVCLVLNKDQNTGTASSLVINRPLALKLTENLARLVLFGAFIADNDNNNTPNEERDLVRFLLAFGDSCGVYVGGPDQQEKAATLIHGLDDLPGAKEISPGSSIYQGGLEAAIDGVLSGEYNPLDFRFFVGRHEYKESELDISVHLGKYQPVACARSVALKQCIQLPKPLWHEVLELCGKDMNDISALELLKRDDIKFEIVDEDDEIPDELSELYLLDEEDDEDDESFLE